MRPRLIVLNVMLVAIGIAAWRSGYFAAFGLLGWQEIAMLVALGAYAAVGLGAAWCGKWKAVAHIANSLPAWALGFTVAGLMLAVSHVHSLTPDALAEVFRAFVLAIAPNLVGVLCFAWLSALAYWAAGEDA